VAAARFPGRVTRAIGAVCSCALLLPTGCRPRVDNDVGAAGDRAATAAAPVAHALSADTLRGVVIETGPAPGSSIMLRVPAGGPVVLRGASLPLLHRVVGLEIVAEGRESGERDVAADSRGARVFQVDRFVVRAADGIPAHDGILTAEDGKYSLALHDGRVLRLPNIPAALRTKPGARVFLAGPLERAPAAYGIISESR
jgi:hypothetical protein